MSVGNASNAECQISLHLSSIQLSMSLVTSMTP